VKGGLRAMLKLLPKREGYFGFRLIGFLKLTSGLLAVVLGLAFVRFVRHDPGETIERFSAHFGLDPHNHLINGLISAITGLDRSHLRAIQAGTFFYAVLHVIEGIGLILERDWAGYLVVVATSSLIPVELYEIVQKQSWVRIAILLVNLGIVAYLVFELRKHHAARKKPAA
jgi:uncharacterized membrane protein (DUF2068 family)